MNERRKFLEYFRNGITLNLIQVIISFSIGLLTTLAVYNKLTSDEFILFTISQLSIFFFVNFSSLELGNYLKKHIPKTDKEKGIFVLLNVFKASLFTFFILFVVYLTLSTTLEIYEFDSILISKNYFFIYIFLATFTQLIVNIFYEFLTALEKFVIIEKLYLKILSPIRFLLTLLFYFEFGTILFALLFNLISRIIQLIIMLKTLENKKTLFSNMFSNSNKFQNLNFLEKFKFSIKNTIFTNYPLMLLAISPNFLNQYFNPEDVAVFSLSLSLFNSIKPILFGMVRIVNPAFVKLVADNNEKVLKLTLKFINDQAILLHTVFISFAWLSLNQYELTSLFLKYFSYSLFADFIISIVVISYLYIMCMIFQSVMLAKNKEKQFFYISLIAFTMSLIYLIIFFNLGLSMNFYLLILIIFYFVQLALMFIYLNIFEKKEILKSYLFIFVILNALRTYIYDGLSVYFTLVILILSISIKLFTKINNNFDL